MTLYGRCDLYSMYVCINEVQASNVDRGLLSTFLTVCFIYLSKNFFCSLTWCFFKCLMTSVIHGDGAFACWSGSFANIARCRLALRCFQGKVSPPWMYFKKCILDCQYGSSAIFFAMATQGTAAQKPVRPKKHFPIDCSIKINASETADRKTFDLQHSS